MSGLWLLGAGAVVLAASVGAFWSLTQPAKAGGASSPSGQSPSEQSPSEQRPDSTATPGPAPTNSGAPRKLQPIPSGAKQLDRASSFSYASQPTSCSAQTLITDGLKGVALDVDEQIRKGSEMSYSEEERMGKKMINQVATELGGKLVDTGATARYLSDVAKPLLRNVQRKDVTYRFYVVEDTDVENALTLPGGFILFTRPMLRKIKNEAQLATILGHEIGHADMRHPIAVFEAMRALGIPEDEAIAQAATAIVRLPYSTSQEERADEYGATAIHEAGYSVFQSVQFWTEQAATAPAPADPKPDDDPLGALIGAATHEVENVLRTHPDDARRACLLKNVAYKLYRDQPRDVAYVGTTNLREQTAMNVRVY